MQPLITVHVDEDKASANSILAHSNKWKGCDELFRHCSLLFLRHI
jgi:hypothetical protein